MFVVVESVKDAYELVTHCDCFKELNLGGATRKENSTKLGPIFFVTNEEIEMLNKMVDLGVNYRNYCGWYRRCVFWNFRIDNYGKSKRHS